MISREGGLIREAVPDDIPRLVEMGRRFFGVSGYPEFAEFDEPSFKETLGKLIDGDDGTVLVTHEDGQVIGMVGVILFPFWFNRHHTTSTELFWWAEKKGNGMELFKAGEAWAADHGAKTMHMAALEALRPDELGAFYERAGYHAHEHAYLKRL